MRAATRQFGHACQQRWTALLQPLAAVQAAAALLLMPTEGAQPMAVVKSQLSPSWLARARTAVDLSSRPPLSAGRVTTSLRRRTNGRATFDVAFAGQRVPSRPTLRLRNYHGPSLIMNLVSQCASCEAVLISRGLKDAEPPGVLLVELFWRLWWQSTFT